VTITTTNDFSKYTGDGTKTVFLADFPFQKQD